MCILKWFPSRYRLRLHSNNLDFLRWFWWPFFFFSLREYYQILFGNPLGSRWSRQSANTSVSFKSLSKLIFLYQSSFCMVDISLLLWTMDWNKNYFCRLKEKYRLIIRNKENNSRTVHNIQNSKYISKFFQ